MNSSYDNRAGLRGMLVVLGLSLLLAVPASAQGWKDWAWWPISGGTQPDVVTSPFGIRNRPGYDCHKGMDLSAYYQWVFGRVARVLGVSFWVPHPLAVGLVEVVHFNRYITISITERKMREAGGWVNN